MRRGGFFAALFYGGLADRSASSIALSSYSGGGRGASMLLRQICMVLEILYPCIFGDSLSE